MEAFFAIRDTKLTSVSNCSGDEAERITKFKDALGLSPEDAAAAHIDVGRRFLRLANEAGRGAQGEYRKVKCCYLSHHLHASSWE